VLYQLFHSSQVPPRLNRFYLSNSRIDKALETARLLKDSPARHAKYREVMQIVQEDAVLLPLWFPHTSIVSNQKLSGWEAKRMSLIDYLTQKTPGP
jgi:peptide/nickel transport system substrate-binding protein